MFRVGLEGWPRWSAHPFVVLSAGGHVYPAFAPNTQVFASNSSEMAAGFFFFWYFLVQNLPQLGMHTVIFSPL